MNANEGVGKLKNIFRTAFWLQLNLKIAAFFEYEAKILLKNYSEPLSHTAFFKILFFYRLNVAIKGEQLVVNSALKARFLMAFLCFLVVSRQYI